MNDPRPLRVVFLVLMAGLGWLVLWLLGLGPAGRLHRLQHILAVEQVVTRPPLTFTAQVDWLLQHRLGQLQHMTLLLALALMVGLSEGLACRRCDPLGGVRLRVWTIGLVGMGVTVALGLVFLVAPWPLQLWQVATAFTVLIGLVGYGLAAGYPSLA